MTKKLNEAAIVNELQGQSAFFRRPDPPAIEPQPTGEAVSQSQPPQNPAISASVAPPERTKDLSPTSAPPPSLEKPSKDIPDRPNARTGARANERTPVRENERVPERPNARTDERRPITRYSFEFFLDQITTLKKLSLEAQMRGEKGSMSEMVRDAVDAYIEKKRKPGTA